MRFETDDEAVALANDTEYGLSAVARLANRELPGHKLRCQILIYPSTDNGPDGARHVSRAEHAQTPPLDAGTMRP